MITDRIPFYKMQGAGNDFIVIDNRQLGWTTAEIADAAPVLCRRRLGIGADGILALDNPTNGDSDYSLIYRNADGSDAGMCGNGARCAALFARKAGFPEQQKFTVHRQQYQAEIHDDDSITIMFPMSTEVRELDNSDDRRIFQVYPGTEHIVLPVEKSTLAEDSVLRSEGERLRYDQRFQPEGTNVNYICGIDEEHLQLQTYERGVENLTLACGTGAIASALAWHHIQHQPAGTFTSRVATKGGELIAGFTYDSQTSIYSHLTLRGPAEFVFEGVYDQ